jgi:hypothetical protein
MTEEIKDEWRKLPNESFVIHAVHVILLGGLNQG